MTNPGWGIFSYIFFLSFSKDRPNVKHQKPLKIALDSGLQPPESADSAAEFFIETKIKYKRSRPNRLFIV
jgi:hypothetical protein